MNLEHKATRVENDNPESRLQILEQKDRQESERRDVKNKLDQKREITEDPDSKVQFASLVIGYIQKNVKGKDQTQIRDELSAIIKECGCDPRKVTFFGDRSDFGRPNQLIDARAFGKDKILVNAEYAIQLLNNDGKVLDKEGKIKYDFKQMLKQTLGHERGHLDNEYPLKGVPVKDRQFVRYVNEVYADFYGIQNALGGQAEVGQTVFSQRSAYKKEKSGKDDPGRLHPSWEQRSDFLKQGDSGKPGELTGNFDETLVRKIASMTGCTNEALIQKVCAHFEEIKLEHPKKKQAEASAALEQGSNSLGDENPKIKQAEAGMQDQHKPAYVEDIALTPDNDLEEDDDFFDLDSVFEYLDSTEEIDDFAEIGTDELFVSSDSLYAQLARNAERGIIAGDPDTDVPDASEHDVPRVSPSSLYAQSVKSDTSRRTIKEDSDDLGDTEQVKNEYGQLTDEDKASLMQTPAGQEKLNAMYDDMLKKEAKAQGVAVEDYPQYRSSMLDQDYDTVVSAYNKAMNPKSSGETAKTQFSAAYELHANELKGRLQEELKVIEGRIVEYQGKPISVDDVPELKKLSNEKAKREDQIFDIDKILAAVKNAGRDNDLEQSAGRVSAIRDEFQTGRNDEVSYQTYSPSMFEKHRLDKNYDSLSKKDCEDLSEDELVAVRHYTAKGFGDINRSLYDPQFFSYSGEYEKIVKEELKEELDAYISALKGCIGRKELPYNTELYRGIKDLSAIFGDDAKHLSVAELNAKYAGKYYENKGFSSTTANFDVTKEFATGRENACFMVIHAPKGTQAMCVGSESRFKTSEKEVLLQCGTVFKINSVSKRDNSIYIDVTVVGCQEESRHGHR